MFVWLPTGYSKSLCYQLIPLMVDCKLEKCGKEDCGYVVMVVSPLISLMIEQVQRLRERGASSPIRGVDVGSTLVPRELLAKEHNIVSGPYKILYSAPVLAFVCLHPQFCCSPNAPSTPLVDLLWKSVCQ